MNSKRSNKLRVSAKNLERIQKDIYYSERNNDTLKEIKLLPLSEITILLETMVIADNMFLIEKFKYFISLEINRLYYLSIKCKKHKMKNYLREVKTLIDNKSFIFIHITFLS